MIGEFTLNNYGKITNHLSLYQPPQEVQELTRYGKEDYSKGHEILTSSWSELNNRNVIEDENKGKMMYNAFVDENVDDPKEAWKFRGTRSAARNRGVALHAIITSGFMFPMVSAQDENNDEDRGVGDFMRDMLIWMGDNSNYRSSFLQVAMGVLTNPITYMGAEHAKVMQKVKVKLAKGYTTKEVLDEELSGFRAPVYSPSDILFTNAYIPPQEFQRQTCIIKQKYLDYADAQKKYGNHENWGFVQKGVNCILNEDDGLFYDVYDSENSNLVKEVILMWRGEDLEVPFLGGVYMGDENVKWNPFKHRDNFNNPKYDVVPFGFNKIGEHFAFYKSAMNAWQWDDKLIDAMWENVMNREFMDLIPPISITGEDQVDTSVAFPGAQFVTSNKDTQVKTIFPPSQAHPYQAIQMIEESMKEGSLSDTSMGQLPDATQKAYSVAKADQNSKIILKGVAQAFGESITAYGRLMINIAIRNYSTVQLEEVSGVLKTKYRQFVLPRQTSKGKSISKILRFSDELVGRTMSEKEKRAYNLKLFKEAGENRSIMVLNPQLAARMRYLTKINPEEMFSENEEYTKRLLMEMYAQFRADPLVDAETLVRKTMYALLRSDGDELLKPQNEIEKMMQMAQEIPQEKGVAKEVANMRPLSLAV